MKRAIYFDTETTGTRPESDRIIELAAYDPVYKRTFEQLINPGIAIPQDAMNIHQISDSMVKDAPTFKEAMEEFLLFCEGDIALVAHNLINFDLPFLEAECRRAQIQLPNDWAYIDSLIWARRYRKDLPRHSLQFLRKIYGIPANQAHRALNDVVVLHEIFQLMIDDLRIDQVLALLESSTKTREEVMVAAKPQEMVLNLF